MTIKLVGVAAAALVLALSGCMNRGSTNTNASGGASDAGSSQSYPAGSTATPSGTSPGQGAGQQGNATTDTSRDRQRR